MHKYATAVKRILADTSWASVAQLDGHPTGESAIFFRGDLTMKFFLRSFSPSR